MSGDQCGGHDPRQKVRCPFGYSAVLTLTARYAMLVFVNVHDVCVFLKPGSVMLANSLTQSCTVSITQCLT